MGLSPRSIAHALRLHVDSPRLRVTRTPHGRAMVFDAPPAREAPAPIDDAADPAPTIQPRRARLIDDPVEVGWRRGLLRAARDGLDHFVPDEPRAQALAEAFGPLEAVTVPGEAGASVARMGLRLTPEVRKSVLGGRMRFARGDQIGSLSGYEPRDLVLAFNDRVTPLDTALDLNMNPERVDVEKVVSVGTTKVRNVVRAVMGDPAAFTALAQRWRLSEDELTRFVADVEGGRKNRTVTSLSSHLRALAERGVLDTESLTRAARDWTPPVGREPPSLDSIPVTVAVIRAEFGATKPPPAAVDAKGKNAIRALRRQGVGPLEIATRLNLPVSVVSGNLMRMKARGETFPALRGRARFAAGAPGARFSPSEIEAEVRSAWGGAGAAFLDIGEIRVVPTHLDAPGDAWMAAPPGTAAVYVDGVTTLIAESINPGRVRSLMLHEIGVHAGLETMIGARRFATLLKKVDQRVAHFRELRERGEADPAGDMWIEAREYAERYAAHEQDITEETIAYAVEMIDNAFTHFPEAADRTLLKSLLDMVRRWFVTTTGIGKITARDLHTLALASLRRQARRAGAAMASVPQSELMRLATARGFKGGDARAALAWLRAQPPQPPRPMLEAMSRADVLGAGEAPAGKGEANIAVGASVVGGAAAVGAGAGGVALTEFEAGREERKAAYEALAADNERGQRVLGQNEAFKAARAERARVIAERDVGALPDMPAEAVGADQRGVYVRELAGWVGEMAGIDPEVLFRLILWETAGTFDPAIANPKSSALGLGQFTKTTWLSELDRSAATYNIDLAGRGADEVLALRADPRIAAAMVAAHARGNAEVMVEMLGRDGVSGGELYAAHFLGVHAAVRLMRAADADMDSEGVKREFASAVFNDEGEEINASVFRAPDGSWRSAREIVAAFNEEFGAERQPLSPQMSTSPADNSTPG